MLLISDTQIYFGQHGCNFTATLYFHYLSLTDGTDYSIGINESTTEFLFEGSPQQECIQINILDDEIVEQNESFLVIINTTLTSQTVSLNPPYAFVTIIDDDRKCSGNS